MRENRRGKKGVQRPNRTILSRTLILMGVCGIVAFAVLVARLFLLQIRDHDHYEQMAIEQQTRDSTVTASRGSILDRGGKVLAMSASVETIFVSPYELNKYGENASVIATRLSEILGVDYTTVMEKFKNTDSWYETVKTKVEPETADKVRAFIEENDLMSVHIEADTKRYYPYSSLACHVIGFVGSDNNGLEGLEYVCDEYLTGTNGRVVRLKNGEGTDMLFTDFEDYYDAQDGYDVTLTIDVTIQSYVEKYLEQAINDYGVRNGAACIALDPKTCEVLALANYGNYDLNNYMDVSDEVRAQLEGVEDDEERDEMYTAALLKQWRNKAISDTYEPGSVFKIITLASALEQGAVTLDDTFYCGGSTPVIGRDPVHCWSSGHGSQTLAEAAQNSCNVAFTEIGEKLGGEAFWSYLEAFGMFDSTGIDLMGEGDSQWWSKDVFCDPDNQSQLAATSFGQTFNITPIQMITAVSAACNGGYLMEPYVVKQITDSEGNVVVANEPTVVRQVISEETSRTVCEILESVVSEGTGKNAYVEGYSIAGKTGTAEKVAQDAAGGPKEYIVSFCGFAPADDPQVIVLLLLDTPSSNSGYYISGGAMAAPVVGNIIHEVLEYMEVEPKYTEEELSVLDVTVPSVTGMSVADATGAVEYDDLEVSVIGDGSTITAQVPAAYSTVAAGSKVILYAGGTADDNEVTVPELYGLTYREAMDRLEPLGLYISKTTGSLVSSGSTVVFTQSYAYGEKVKYGTVIGVTLVDMSNLGFY